MQVDIKFDAPTIEKLLKNMVVIVDTREDKEKPIIKYLQRRKVPFVYKKLNYGDYSCMIKKNEELGLPYDITLEKKIVIECKQNLEELSGNFTNSRVRFENEFIRAQKDGCDIHLLVESGSWYDIYKHNYKTAFNEKSFYNSLLSFQRKYDMKIHFTPSELSGLHVLRLLQAELKKFLE